MPKYLNLLVFCLLFNGIALAQSPQKMILLEKVTSAGCGGCAYGDYIVDSLLAQNNNLIPVHMHWHDGSHPDSMYCADGDSVWMEVATISPGFMIDRVDFPNASYGLTTSFTEGVQQFIDQRNQDTVFCNVTGSAYISGFVNWIDVEIQVEFLEPTTGDIRVNAYLVKDSITEVGFGYDQRNSFNNSSSNPMFGMGDPITPYVHKHVLEDMLGGPWGLSGVIPSSVNAGETYSHLFSQNIEPEHFNDASNGDLKVIVLVQRFHADSSKREILNAYLTDVVDAMSVSEPHQFVLKVYPNPAASEIWVEGLKPGGELILYDATGRVVVQQPIKAHQLRVDVSSLSPGFYSANALYGGDPHGRATVIIKN